MSSSEYSEHPIFGLAGTTLLLMLMGETPERGGISPDGCVHGCCLFGPHSRETSIPGRIGLRFENASIGSMLHRTPHAAAIRRAAPVISSRGEPEPGRFRHRHRRWFEKSLLKGVMGMPSILIVEKNEFLRKSLREAVEAQFPDCSFEDTGDGRVALQKAQARTPVLAFVDIRPDGMSGLELTGRMKDAHPEMVICLLTDSDLPEYFNSARKHGADHCFSKDSLTTAHLHALIVSILRKGARAVRAKARRQRLLGGRTAERSAVVY